MTPSKYSRLQLVTQAARPGGSRFSNARNSCVVSYHRRRVPAFVRLRLASRYARPPSTASVETTNDQTRRSMALLYRHSHPMRIRFPGMADARIGWPSDRTPARATRRIRGRRGWCLAASTRRLDPPTPTHQKEHAFPIHPTYHVASGSRPAFTLNPHDSDDRR